MPSFTKEELQNFDRIQSEVHSWSMSNFEGQSAVLPLLGCVEETGEIVEAVQESDVVEVKDGLGDSVVFLCDSTARNNILLSSILSSMIWVESDHSWTLRETTKADAEDVLIAMGRMCHATLKQEQKIRRGENHVEAFIKETGEWLVSLLQYTGFGSEDLPQIVENVWNKVKERNWKKNPVDGKLI